MEHTEPIQLSARQFELLGHAYRGYPDKQIASLMGITAKSVGNRKTELYRLFNVYSQSELIKKMQAEALRVGEVVEMDGLRYEMLGIAATSNPGDGIAVELIPADWQEETAPPVTVTTDFSKLIPLKFLRAA